MDTPDDIKQIQASAEKLQKVIKTKLDGGLQGMKAVQERLEMYNIQGNNFSNRIFEYLKTQFDHQVSQNARRMAVD